MFPPRARTTSEHRRTAAESTMPERGPRGRPARCHGASPMSFAALRPRRCPPAVSPLGGLLHLPVTPVSSLLSEPRRPHRPAVGSWITEPHVWHQVSISLVPTCLVQSWHKTAARSAEGAQGTHSPSTHQTGLPWWPGTLRSEAGQCYRSSGVILSAQCSCLQMAGQPWGNQGGVQTPSHTAWESGVSSCMEFSIVSDTTSPLWPWS